MKIAFVNQSLNGGGAERATVNLANRLSEIAGNEVFLFTGEKKENDYAFNSSIKRECILEMKLFKDVSSLKRSLKKHDIDITIGMGIYANFCVCLANFGIRTKMIISERNSPAHDHISKKSKLLRFLTYRNADAYVFQTEGARSFYSKSIQKRGTVIHNPVKDGLPMRSGTPKKEIVATGRLMPQKNYPMLLRAMKKINEVYPEYTLRIFGTGKELEKLQSMTFELGIDKCVKFEGFCIDVHEQMKNSEIFVMSSDFEGMPNALMEAMAMGFPVVTTDCPSGGPAELIKNNVNGILIPVNDSDAMADSIIKLIEDKEFADKIASNAIDIRNTHSEERIAQQWMSMFVKLQ